MSAPLSLRFATLVLEPSSRRLQLSGSRLLSRLRFSFVLCGSFGAVLLLFLLCFWGWLFVAAVAHHAIPIFPSPVLLLAARPVRSSNMMKCVSLMSLALMGVVNGDRAHLLVEKSFANPPVVEGKDVNITLSITNVGDSAANDVVLSDKVRTQNFELKAGEPVTKFDSIARWAFCADMTCEMQNAAPCVGFARACAGT